MLKSFFEKIIYKFEELYSSKKVLASIKSISVENNKIKIYYTFKKKPSLIANYFYLTESYKYPVKFSAKEGKLLLKLMGVYEYLTKYGNITDIKVYIDEISL